MVYGVVTTIANEPVENQKITLTSIHVWVYVFEFYSAGHRFRTFNAMNFLAFNFVT